MSENTLSTITDCDLLEQQLARLLGQERDVQTAFLITLAAFDRARGYEKKGYATLWDYCRQELRLLEGATFRRIHAARLLDRFPQAKALLLDGRLFMTTLVQLEEVITEENADELFALASWKSKAEVAYLVACRGPAPKEAPRPAVIRPVARPRVAELPPVAADAPLFAAVAPRPAPTIQPVAEDRFTIKLTVSKAFVDTLDEAKRVLSHRVPTGEVEAVLRAALEDLIAREAKRNAPKVAKKEAPRSAPSPQRPPAGRGSRKAIPAAVRREVWARDGGCCAWKKADGTTCNSRWKLQLDHIVAYALGGDSTVGNLRVLCAAHNAQHARETFGEDHMTRARTSAGGSRRDRPEASTPRTIPGGRSSRPVSLRGGR